MIKKIIGLFLMIPLSVLFGYVGYNVLHDTPLEDIFFAICMFVLICLFSFGFVLFVEKD